LLHRFKKITAFIVRPRLVAMPGASYFGRMAPPLLKMLFPPIPSGQPPAPPEGIEDLVTED
jgi:hypothetical protein